MIKILAISHCNCPERVQMVKEALLERMQVKDVIILDTAGVSSMYANDGGIMLRCNHAEGSISQLLVIGNIPRGVFCERRSQKTRDISREFMRSA